MKTRQDHLHRRQFLTSASLLAATMLVAPTSLLAQSDSPVTRIIDEARKSAITATKLRGDLTLLEGSGGNIVLLSGKKGNLMVDAGIDVSEGKIKQKIAGINNVPVQYLINTHWHFDHTSGNHWIGHDGAKIIAQQNTSKWLSRTTRVDDWNYTFPAASREAIPTSLFREEHQVDFEGHVIHLKHYAPAHTDSDIFVHFQAVDVLHVGDTWWNGHYPFIDYNTNGNIHGMIKAAEQNIQMSSAKTLLIPGHGPIGKKADLISYHEMLVSIEGAVSKLKKSGMSLKEVIAARPTKKFDEKWGKFVIGAEVFTALVYKGIS